MAKTGRNAPCPCGSGKKYKHCHLREHEAASRAAPPVTADTADAEPEALVPQPPPRYAMLVPWAIGLVGLALSAWAFQVRGPTAGGSVAVATCLAVAAWFIFLRPPPRKEDAGDPAGIDFGRTNR